MEGRIMRWGNSLAIRIPKSLAAETHLEYGTEVSIVADQGSLIVRPAPPRRPDLKTLLAGVTKSNVHAEVTTGPRKGREGW